MKLDLFRAVVLLGGCVLAFSSCRTRNAPPPLENPEEIPPAEYGEAGGIPEPPGGPGQGGRFGYRGNDAGQAPPPPPPRPGTRDVREMDNGGGLGLGQNTKKEEKEEPKPSSAPSSMQFANKVPGNPLVVTLPGQHASLGQISIEKYDSAGKPTGEPLKRGTQVQIPDPNNPGQKIYFKVP